MFQVLWLIYGYLWVCSLINTLIHLTTVDTTVLFPLLNNEYLLPIGSDGCIYETLIPIYSSDTEKNHRLIRALMLKAVVSDAARNGTALTILDQDHVAVLGPPLPASKGN